MSRYLLFVLCLGTISCSPQTPGEKLAGKWGLDVNCTLEADPELSKVTPRVRAQMSHFVSPYLETVFFTFEKEGVLRLQLNHFSETQYYRITSQNQSSRLNLEVSAERDFSPTENMLAEFNGDGLKLTVGDRVYCLDSD